MNIHVFDLKFVVLDNLGYYIQETKEKILFMDLMKFQLNIFAIPLFAIPLSHICIRSLRTGFVHDELK